MSAAEEQSPLEAWTPNPNETEVERARKEDPAFRVDFAKALAKGRGETYRPEKHGPFEAKPVPRHQREKEVATGPLAGELDELLARFEKRGARPPNRYLKVEK